MMNILLLNGSPNPDGNTVFLADAFRKGAEEAGNKVLELQAGAMDIHGCQGCNYCKGEGAGTCIRKDDQERVYQAMKEADVIVLASPVYYFMLSAQLEAAIQRLHATGIPGRIKKSALILSSGSDDVYDAIIMQYHMIFRDYCSMQDMGIYTAHGAQNKTKSKASELEAFGRSIGK